MARCRMMQPVKAARAPVVRRVGGAAHWIYPCSCYVDRLAHAGGDCAAGGCGDGGSAQQVPS